MEKITLGDWATEPDSLENAMHERLKENAMAIDPFDTVVVERPTYMELMQAQLEESRQFLERIAQLQPGIMHELQSIRQILEEQEKGRGKEDAAESV